ncbi:glutaredoxin domain-containing protein [Bacillus toyonensis]|uniref:glutaredoxin family protein n=1 Tax=Bacillus toyonensis TaxID=155322 RepID=UPI003467838E
MKLYTKTICPKCLWVKSELQNANLEFDLINIEQDETAKEIILNAGFFSVPIIECEGKFIGDLQEIFTTIKMLQQ